MKKPVEGPELVIGLVGALGADLTELSETLERALGDLNYRCRLIRLSQLLHDIAGLQARLKDAPLDDHIESHQQGGNEFRRRTRMGSALAILGMLEVRNLRKSGKSSESRTAYIIRSLKHRKEAEALKATYGPHFFLLASYLPKERRVATLAAKIAQSRHSNQTESFEARARDLIQRDQDEPDEEFGQKVRETFPQADAFFAAESPDRLRDEVNRFIEIAFGYPFHTPQQDEFGMFQAQGAALRSADLSRQVGAAVTAAEGDVVALGMNEVPKYGGGLYWPYGEKDARDFALGHNVAQEMRSAAIGELLSKLEEEGLLREDIDVAQTLETVLPALKGTELMGIGEFGRPVHAEMAALIDAARRGVSVKGGTLYTTTFPCQHCTRHIIAAGIERVVFIEPYPKSHAKDLHEDSIAVESAHRVPERVNFEPFVGIAPGRYMEFFDMRLVEPKDERGQVARWKKAEASPRGYDRWPLTTYEQSESLLIRDLEMSMSKEGLHLEETE